MAAHKWIWGACGGCPRGENVLGIGWLNPHVERMSVCVCVCDCVCVCVRGLHSKLPLELEEELYSQMNTMPPFYSQ